MQNRTWQFGCFALLLAITATFSACGSTNVDAAHLVPGGGSDGEAGAAGAASEQQLIELAFNPPGNIVLDPKESRELTVRATELDHSPSAQIPIRFALLGGDAAADAVLDATDVQTDESGLAHVTLIAPSQPTTFSVRASSPRAQVAPQQTITVRASGMTELRVLPAYDGQRPVTRWTATARAGVSCNDLEGNPPPDGNWLTSAKPGAPLMLEVPVNVSLAITVRAGHYIGGCVNQSPLSEGDGNQVLVYASDRPLDLDATALTVSFGATDAHPAFDQLLSDSTASITDALLGGATNDVAALLEGMRDATPVAEQEAFDTARSDHSWDVALQSGYGKNATRCLRDPAQRWLTAGLVALNAPDALRGKLTAHGIAASFTPLSIGGAAPADAGMADTFPATWSADSNDAMLLGVGLTWQTSRLITALAAAPALVDFPAASSVEQALSLSVGCEQVAATLLTAGETPGSAAFASCGRSCVVQACESAVAAAWNRAQASSDTESGSLRITAGGMARVGDDARAVALSGTWVGELQVGEEKAAVSGALSAKD